MSDLYDPRIEQALQSFISDHPGMDTRNQAIAAILINWFTSHGYLPHDQEGIRPENLDAYERRLKLSPDSSRDG